VGCSRPCQGSQPHPCAFNSTSAPESGMLAPGPGLGEDRPRALQHRVRGAVRLRRGRRASRLAPRALEAYRELGIHASGSSGCPGDLDRPPPGRRPASWRREGPARSGCPSRGGWPGRDHSAFLGSFPGFGRYGPIASPTCQKGPGTLVWAGNTTGAHRHAKEPASREAPVSGGAGRGGNVGCSVLRESRSRVPWARKDRGPSSPKSN